VVIGNFSEEMIGLYYNAGNGLFTDMAPGLEIGRISNQFLTFGCLFLDLDNDGWADIFAANGHVQPAYDRIQPKIGYAQRPLVFRNRGATGRVDFQEVGLASGDALRRRILARGLAAADIDLDGDLDVALTTNNGPAILLRNDGGNGNNSIRLVLEGTKSNRSGIGAVVKVKLGHDVLRLLVRSGSSYLSQSELPLTVGLGRQPKADGIAIHWPSGTVTKLENVTANQIIVVNEDQGMVRQIPLTQS